MFIVKSATPIGFPSRGPCLPYTVPSQPKCVTPDCWRPRLQRNSRIGQFGQSGCCLIAIHQTCETGGIGFGFGFGTEGYNDTRQDILTHAHPYQYPHFHCGIRAKGSSRRLIRISYHSRRTLQFTLSVSSNLAQAWSTLLQTSYLLALKPDENRRVNVAKSSWGTSPDVVMTKSTIR